MKKRLNQKIQFGYLVQHSLFNFSKLAKNISANEGFRSYVYNDQFKNPTIGHGHLITTTDVFLRNKKYSKETLVNIFYKDLRKSISDFKKNYNFEIIVYFSGNSYISLKSEVIDVASGDHKFVDNIRSP